MADRVAVMRAGGLVQVDQPEAIHRRPADLFVARLFCELNEVTGRVQGDRIETPLGTFAAAGLPEGVAAVVAIRPQGVRIRPAGEGVPGRLERRRFLGVVELVEVVVAGIDHPLKGRIRDGISAPAKSEVGVMIDPAEVLVFAVSDA
jgi:iron(III) transport system ATP-binding protein